MTSLSITSRHDEPSNWSSADDDLSTHMSTHELLNIDLIEGMNSYTLLCDMPGVGEEDVDMTICGKDLTIQAKRFRPLSGRVCHGEREFGCLNRRIRLPDNCDKDSALAKKCQHGILKIVFEKKESKLGSLLKKIHLH